MSNSRRARRERARREHKLAPVSAVQKRKSRWLLPVFSLLAISLAGAFIFSGFLHQPQPKVSIPAIPEGKRSHRLSDIVDMTAEQLSMVDIAEVNLLCATGLPGSENFDIQEGLKTLDHWADSVQSETARNFHRFKTTPGEYESSEAFYRMGMLVTVLQQDLGIRYNPDLIDVPENDAAKLNRAFLTDSSNMFLTGVLGRRRLGSCSSMPVLYVAVARRLGYPVKLVLAKDHVFVRWDGSDGTVMNIEGTNHGIVAHSDDYYREWRHISREEIADGLSLKSLSRGEELATFLITRSGTLAFHDRIPEAVTAASEASRLWPKDKISKKMLAAYAAKLPEEEFRTLNVPPTRVTDQKLAGPPTPTVTDSEAKNPEKAHP
jgi:hypothetical protein